ncbi:MAG TPA: type II toxin-antitoxin system VapC family toxin [Candidatus Binatia bacterium]|nr:type II toxin-antitoxin system VapC family toxin [Candidatus Binatia bacterium]
MVYVESSAILSWLLGEPSGPAARDVLAAAEAIVASDLTLLECDRALIRGVATGEVAPAEAGRARTLLNRAARHWNLLRIDGEVVARARKPFPIEPLRALDAIHLASALIVAADVPEFSLLTFDQRIRETAREMGLTITPAR